MHVKHDHGEAKQSQRFSQPVAAHVCWELFDSRGCGKNEIPHSPKVLLLLLREAVRDRRVNTGEPLKANPVRCARACRWLLTYRDDMRMAGKPIQYSNTYHRNGAMCRFLLAQISLFSVSWRVFLGFDHNTDSMHQTCHICRSSELLLTKFQISS